MKVTLEKVQKYQEGGQMPMGEEAPQGGAPQESQESQEDPIMVLAQMSQQALQSGNCDQMAQVCQAFIELVQQASGGGAAQAPEGGEPVYKKGGKLVRRIKN